MTADHSPMAIDLALEPAFSLAGMDVRPATLEILAGAQHEHLEPRIMQVLVALARRRGEVVSRDQLIQACWAGRAVGEDAINRCIFRLRKLAETCGGFRIETVPRVGFRLSETLSNPPESRSGARRRGWVAAALALSALALVGGVWAWRYAQREPAAESPRVAVSAFKVVTDDLAARAFSAELAEQVTGVLGEHALGVGAPDGRSTPRGADMVLDGAVSRENGSWRVRALLRDPRTGFTLWSSEFSRPVGQEPALRDELAVATTDTVYMAISARAQPAVRLDPVTLALWIRVQKALTGASHTVTDDPRQLCEQVLARAPRFAEARAVYSLTLIDASLGAPAGEREALEARGKAEAMRALRQDPRAGAAYDALYILARQGGPSQLASSERLLLNGIAAAPDYSYLHMRECRFLIEVGRAADAVRYCQRAVALRPLTGPVDATYVRAVYAHGDKELAMQAAELSARFHPDHIPTRRIRFEIEAFDGSPDRALALLHDPAMAPQTFRAATIEGLDLFLKARKSGAEADAKRAVSALWAASSAPNFDRRYLVLVAARLGQVDDAFRALDRFGAAPPPRDAGFEPSPLFEPAAAPLRRDPRFWPAAAKAGYVRYWQETDRWPDFCADPNLPFDCRKAAAGAAAGSG